jgi:hypothetical protein
MEPRKRRGYDAGFCYRCAEQIFPAWNCRLVVASHLIHPQLVELGGVPAGTDTLPITDTPILPTPVRIINSIVGLFRTLTPT